ncbi:MAG: type II toxin-antitoxin system Phd/YefM family antitoxin [bacterium]
MKVVNTHEAKTHLSRILDEVESGEVYVITRNGKPIAELRKRRATKRTEPDPVLAQIQIDYDPAEELTTDEWATLRDPLGYVRAHLAGSGECQDI